MHISILSIIKDSFFKETFFNVFTVKLELMTFKFPFDGPRAFFEHSRVPMFIGSTVTQLFTRYDIANPGINNLKFSTNYHVN